MNNPGRYLTLLPPVNGASASSGTPYFHRGSWPGRLHVDSTAQFPIHAQGLDHLVVGSRLPSFIIPYFAGVGGVTPAFGNNRLASKLHV